MKISHFSAPFRRFRRLAQPKPPPPASFYAYSSMCGYTHRSFWKCWRRRRWSCRFPTQESVAVHVVKVAPSHFLASVWIWSCIIDLDSLLPLFNRLTSPPPLGPPLSFSPISALSLTATFTFSVSSPAGYSLPLSLSARLTWFCFGWSLIWIDILLSVWLLSYEIKGSFFY